MAKYLIKCHNYSPIVAGDTLAEALMNYLENWTTNGLPIKQETYEALSNGLTVKQLVEFANAIIGNDYSSEQIKDIYKFEKIEKIY
jgi:hypothetical protein|nr:MAG TPA: hypothetical protein [Caudoviricetes sp.]